MTETSNTDNGVSAQAPIIDQAVLTQCTDIVDKFQVGVHHKEIWYVQLCCMVRKQPHQHYITKLKWSKSVKVLINSSYKAKVVKYGDIRSIFNLKMIG